MFLLAGLWHFILYGFAPIAAVLALLWLVWTFPPTRRLVRDILLALRHLLAELPLRAVTGRRHPDYPYTAALEHECGMEISDPCMPVRVPAIDAWRRCDCRPCYDRRRDREGSERAA